MPPIRPRKANQRVMLEGLEAIGPATLDDLEREVMPGMIYGRETNPTLPKDKLNRTLYNLMRSGNIIRTDCIGGPKYHSYWTTAEPTPFDFDVSLVDGGVETITGLSVKLHSDSYIGEYHLGGVIFEDRGSRLMAWNNRGEPMDGDDRYQLRNLSRTRYVLLMERDGVPEIKAHGPNKAKIQAQDLAEGETFLAVAQYEKPE